MLKESIQSSFTILYQLSKHHFLQIYNTRVLFYEANSFFSIFGQVFFFKTFNKNQNCKSKFLKCNKLNTFL